MLDIKPGIPSFYSPTQLQDYLNRIGFSEDALSLKPDIKNLERLVHRHLMSFPYENTRLHYDANHEVDIDPQFVFSRMVETRQGGTWCFGHNDLFLGMLRALGYRAITVSARVNQNSYTSPELPADFSFLCHMFCFVQFPTEDTPEKGSSQTYLVDVGFGGAGLVRPILVESGQTVQGAAYPEEHRIMRRSHPESSLSNTSWALERRCASDWAVLYIFNEVETYPADWIAYNQWFCAHPIPRIKDNVVCVQYFAVGDVEEDGIAPAVGRLILFDKTVKRRVGLETTLIKEFTNEKERVQTIKDDFGILVEEREIQNIMNRTAALSL